MQTHDEDVKKLAALIKDITIAMLTTVTSDGSLRSRPMYTQQQEFDGTLWFFLGKHSHTVEELSADPRVNVSYAATGDNNFVSVSGTATLVGDRAKAEQLWSPLYKAWYPGGLDDPNLALLRVDIERAEYWDAPSSAVVQLAGFVKAIVTGQAAKGAENRRIDL